MTRKEGGTAPQDSPIGFGSRRLLLAPRREKARCRLRLPAPLLRGKATPQLCARAARSSGSASSLPPHPRGPAPLLAKGEERRRPRRQGRAQDQRGARGRPPGNWLLSGHSGFALPRRRGPSRSGQPLPSPSALQPHWRRAGNFVPGDRFLSAPGSAPARRRRPPQAGLRERGARGHLTARPINQRPPRAPSRAAAAGLALGWPGAAHPEWTVRAQLAWMPRADTIPFIQIIRKCESHPPHANLVFGQGGFLSPISVCWCCWIWGPSSKGIFILYSFLGVIFNVKKNLKFCFTFVHTYKYCLRWPCFSIFPIYIRTNIYYRACCKAEVTA